MRGWMYILKCADDTCYTGSTNNLLKRLAQHQQGVGANYTKKRLPVQLVYFEEFDRVDRAFYREQQVKSWSQPKKEALMDQNLELVHILAVCQNETHYRNAGFSFAKKEDFEFD